jgi:predicted acetyltransferase
MDYEMRSITPQEWPRFRALMGEVFAEDWSNEADAARSLDTAELDRSVAVFDGAEMVGTAGVYSLRTRVPGGVLPTAGVTWVTVRSTHRRRGILTAMMRRMLEGARERGEPLASLWAAESVIYGRYGFGAAGLMGNFTIDPRHAKLITPAPRGGCRLLPPEVAAALLPPIYDRATADRPGTLERSPTWWGRRFHDWGGQDGGYSRKRHVIYERDGRGEAYAIFRVKGDWGEFPDHRVRVLESCATDADAQAGIWRYLFGIDLVTQLEAYFRPLDDPLFFMLADPRRLRIASGDEIWLRPVDVAAALSGRRYLGAGTLRLAVHDAFMPDNDGVYELEVADGAGACRRLPAGSPADVELAGDALGALYLGDNSPLWLRDAGRLVENRPGAALDAHRLLHWPVRPQCPEVY